MGAGKTTRLAGKPRKRIASREPPGLVLCAGLKSSASTWLYNAVIGLLRADGRRVAAFYADDIADFPRGAERADTIVVKTHIPSPALQFAARMAGAVVFVTVREPRDAVASLMRRFHHRFDNCLREVAPGAAAMAELTQMKPCVLRYEHRFYERGETMDRVAAHLGVKVNSATLRAIAATLTPDKVTAKIARLARAGTFGAKPDPDRFDPKTHWHPGHVGDGSIGKHFGVLSPRQARYVLGATRAFRTTFGYDGPNREGTRGRRLRP